MANILNEKAYKIRKLTLESIYHAGSGHTGGSLGLADIFSVLYFHQMKHKADNPKWSERDRLVLSIGHVAPVHYATLALAGYFPIGELNTLRKLGSRLQGHPGRDFGLEGLELSAGSLGQGLSVAVGMALAAKHQNEKHQIYAIVGDGELQEGSIWEAAMSAAHYNLDNLTVIVDRNGVQIDGSTEDVMKLEPLDKKWDAFGWNVIKCNGNEIAEIKEAFDKTLTNNSKPNVIIATTKMGKGIAEIEDEYLWHGRDPNKDELETFINALTSQ